MITTNKVQPKVENETVDKLTKEMNELRENLDNGKIKKDEYDTKAESLQNEINKELKLNTLTTNECRVKKFPDDYDFPDYGGYEPAPQNDLSKLGMITTGNYKEKLRPYLEPKKKAGRPKKDG